MSYCVDSDITSATPHSQVVPGVIIGPWLIRERVDKGTFGVVFRVTRAGHPEAGDFALKLAVSQGDFRFTREVVLLQSLQHPSVPRFEDRGWWTSGSGGQYPYLVMEWVEGEPLYRWARSKGRTSREVLQVLAQLASALATAHAQGGLHRDVKGDNVLVTGEGRAVLLDWGCGKHLGAEPLTDGPLGPGTSVYRSPEALRWGWAHRKDGALFEAGPADDVYALGVTAYRCTTGTYPPPPTEGPGPQRRLVHPSELSTVSTGLERQMLLSLSWERLQRPPAAALSVALLAAAEQEEARVPIIPTPPAESTSPGKPRWERLRPQWVDGAVVAICVLFGFSLLVVAGERLCAGWELPHMLTQAPGPEAQDGGVGEEALTSVETVPRTALPVLLIAKPLPPKPFPGQRKPPCAPRFETEIMGACWTILRGEPPCGQEGYDHDGLCLRASFDAPRQPTSEDQP